MKTYVHTNLYINVLNSFVFIWKNSKYPFEGEWINYSTLIEWNTTEKEKEKPTDTCKNVDESQTIILSESQKKKGIYCTMSFIEKTRKCKLANRVRKQINNFQR